jgi:UrcA family protein
MKTLTNHFSFSIRNFARAAILGATAIASTAGTSRADAPGIDVKYGDLDLTKASGAVTLYGRIYAAARQVCAPVEGRSLDESTAWKDCVTQAIARAVADVNKPTLTSYHFAKTHKASNPSVVADQR